MELIGSVLIFVSIYDYFTFLKSFFFSKELWDPNCIEWKLSEVWITCSYKWLYNNDCIYTHKPIWRRRQYVSISSCVYVRLFSRDFYTENFICQTKYTRTTQFIHQNLSVYSVYCILIFFVQIILLAGVSNLNWVFKKSW